MPEYVYSTRRVSRKALRPLEVTVWIGLAVMLAFLLLSSFHPGVKELVQKDARIFPFALVTMYVLFLIPSRRLFRYQRFGQIGLSTTRKGFTFKDLQTEKILSWRDVTEARVLLDCDPNLGAYVRRFILVHGKGRITLDNDVPRHILEGWLDLLREIDSRVKKVTYLFHWFHPVCPFCKGKLELAGCASCGRPVRYVNKLLRPWEVLREEGIYLLLILFVAGPRFYPLLLIYLIVAIGFPLLSNRAASLKPLALEASEEPLEPDEEPTPPRKGGKTAVAMVFGILLMVLSASAAPSPSPAPSAPALDVGVADRAYFPLAVGNTWEYTSNLARVQQKVTGREIVNGVSAYVLESFVDGSAESSQKEYFAYTPQGLRVLKRVHKGSDYFLDVPEPMLMYPLAPGRRWTWQGSPEEGNVFMAFHVRPPARITVMGRSLITLPVTIHGRSADGSEIQTKRWYARGIGMVRELTLMKKSFQSFKLEAMLQHYSVRDEEPVP